MSDLYKEINGKVGIVELAKIAYKGDIYFHSLKGGILGFSSTNANYQLSFSNDFFELSVMPKEVDNSHCVPINQLELFEYLFANHYDIYGLIN